MSAAQLATLPKSSYGYFYILVQDRLTGETMYARAIADLKESLVSLVFNSSMQLFPEMETNPCLKDWVQRSKDSRLSPEGNWKWEERIKIAATAKDLDCTGDGELLKKVDKIKVRAEISGNKLCVKSLEANYLSMVPRLCLTTFPNMRTADSTFHISIAGTRFNASDMFSRPDQISLKEEGPFGQPRVVIDSAEELDLTAFWSERRISYTPSSSKSKPQSVHPSK